MYGIMQGLQSHTRTNLWCLYLCHHQHLHFYQHHHLQQNAEPMDSVVVIIILVAVIFVAIVIIVLMVVLFFFIIRICLGFFGFSNKSRNIF